MKIRHTHVFTNIGTTKPLGVYIAALTDDNRLGERLTPVVLLDYAGNIREAVQAFDDGKPKRGTDILHNLA